jgi:thiamine biosynthesis lipoprotein
VVSKPAEQRSYRFRAMGSPCELRLFGPDPQLLDRAAERAGTEIARLERKYSRYRDDSLTSAIHRSAGDARGIELDAETTHLLEYARTCHEQSDGLFDLTSGVLREVWDFRSGRVPSRDEVARVLERVGWSKLVWRPPLLVLPIPGMQLDFGGFVKEYAADRAAQVCRDAGVRHGIADLGGDLAAVGPRPDGRPWNVGVRHPRRPRAAIASVPLARGGLATSGDYERFMVVDGVRYSHILDPRSGWPVAGLACVSVLAPSCLIAGTATTIAMLKGDRAGPAWLDRLGLPNLRVTQSGEVSGTLACAQPAARTAGMTSRAKRSRSLGGSALPK